MRADNEFLGSLVGKLTEIADKCADVGTQSELNELVEILVDAIERPKPFVMGESVWGDGSVWTGQEKGNAS